MTVWRRAPTPDMGAVVTLFLTGSVASIKTFQMIDVLERQRLQVQVVATPAAWPFIEGESKYRGNAEQIQALRARAIPADQLDRCRAAIDQSSIVLVAPASADFIRQIARRDTPLGDMVAACGKPIAVAPAMNFMMWQHPAVQDNVDMLLRQGIYILGPVSGNMACGDQGFGRFAEPADIAEAVSGILQNKLHPLMDRPAAQPSTRRLAQALTPTARKILWIVQPGLDVRSIASYLEGLKADGFDVRCVLAPTVADGLDIRQMERQTGHPVCWDHYQLYPNDGMEHIWLPEESDVVLMYPLSPEFAHEMARGAAESFIGCLYLASKRPVIAVPGGGTLSQEDIEVLARHGVVISESPNIKKVIAALPKTGTIKSLDLAGKDVLVLGGKTRERVDSFRFYTNEARPEAHGQKVAEALTDLGVRVSYIQADGSAAALLASAQKYQPGDFAAVIQVANIAQFMSPAPVTHKIQKTGSERHKLFEVCGNVDVLKSLQKHFGAEKVYGYDSRQVWAAPASRDAAKVHALVRRSAKMPASLPVAREGRFSGARPRAVVTTGRTSERLTPEGTVMTNGFTGQQGRAIAGILAEQGFDVALISGPTGLPDLDHPNISTIHVTSMQDMFEAVKNILPQRPDVFMSVAAVSDFSLPLPFTGKMPENEDTISLDFVENPSIVGFVARHPGLRPRVVVSFAAQSPETLKEYALKKFQAMGVDMTVANPIGPGMAINRDPSRNQVCLIFKHDNAIATEDVPEASKQEIAQAIVRRTLDILKGSK